jgi:hypothetical protein
MRKFLFGVIVVIIVGIVVVALPKHAKEKESDYRDEGKTEEVVDDSDEFTIELLSDKDIYFKADTTLPNIPLINDMLDVANSFAIMRAAYCDAELWFRFNMSVNDEIGSLKTDIIKDKAIRTAAEKYVKDLVNILPKGTILEKPDSILWDKVWKAYMTYGDKLSSRFALDHYGKITKKDVVNYMAIRQFIPNYDSIYNLRHNQSEENERYLLMMAEQTPNFDRECLYTVEYAHQRRHEEPHNAIPMLEKLMESGRFSRYLHEVWRTWRCLRQVAESPSRDGMILNLEYNKMRYRCMNTILRQIIKNPKDIYAINDFCFLATYDNIIRYSDYMFGNSAPLEQMMLFPEIQEE